MSQYWVSRDNTRIRVSIRVLSMLTALTLINIQTANAGAIYWEAADGLPELSGWNSQSTGAAASISFVDDYMRLESMTLDRNYWNQQITYEPNLITGGVQMVTEVQVVSATRERTNRALGILGVGEARNGTGNYVDVYATEDTVFVVDSDQNVVDEFAFDTTDDFHTYRGESYEGVFKLYVDGELVSTVLTGSFVETADGFAGNFGDGSNASASVSLWRSASLAPLFEFEAGAGSTEEDPILPSELPADVSDEVAQAIEDGGFFFSSAPSGVWFDPPVASGFDFQTTNGSLFTLATLPTGFSSPFSIYSNGSFLGEFQGGETVNFGAGVSAFSVMNINPLVDVGDSSAFPIYLEFDQPFGAFTMTPTGVVPEPSAFALCGIGGLILAGYGWRRKRGQAA